MPQRPGRVGHGEARLVDVRGLDGAADQHLIGVRHGEPNNRAQAGRRSVWRANPPNNIQIHFKNAACGNEMFKNEGLTRTWWRRFLLKSHSYLKTHLVALRMGPTPVPVANPFS